jgi:hypothetical protein
MVFARVFGDRVECLPKPYVPRIFVHPGVPVRYDFQWRHIEVDLNDCKFSA